jgi:hypothetical protein
MKPTRPDAPAATFGNVPTQGKPQGTTQPKAQQATTGTTVKTTDRQSRQG